jgi:hypothetical protein
VRTRRAWYVSFLAPFRMKHLRVYRHIALRRDHPRRHVADGPRRSRGTWTNEAKHVNSPKAANRARHIFAPRNWCVRNLLAQSAPPALSLIGRLPACICHRSWAVVAPLAKRAARHQLRAAAPRSHAVRSQQGFLQPCASPLVLMHPVANPFFARYAPRAGARCRGARFAARVRAHGLPCLSYERLQLQPLRTTNSCTQLSDVSRHGHGALAQSRVVLHVRVRVRM